MTGGSRGIGLMIAKGYIEAGANVLLTSRDDKACKEAAASLNSSNVHYVTSNVSSREGCVALAEHTASLFNNKLDVLVNNAGTCVKCWRLFLYFSCLQQYLNMPFASLIYLSFLETALLPICVRLQLGRTT